MRSTRWLIGAALTALVGFGLLRLLGPNAPSAKGGVSESGLYCDFERLEVWDTSPEQGFELSLSTEHATQGIHALKAVFPQDEWPSINTKKLRQPVRQFDALTLDVFNPQDHSVPFAVRLDDQARKKVTISYALEPGMNQVRIARDRLGSLDTTKLFFVVFFLENPGRPVTLYFDNLRLADSRTASQPPPPAPAQAAPQSGVAEAARVVPPPAVPPAQPVPPILAEPVAKPPPEAPPQTSGELAVNIVRLEGPEHEPALVSTGVPFAPGQLRSERDLRFLRAGQELALATQVLARWPQDGSIRSVLVQFRLPLAQHADDVMMSWGQPRATQDLELTPVTWTQPQAWLLLPAYWLCESQVIGAQVPLYGHPFAQYDEHFRQFYPARRDDPPQGDIRTDGYYSTPHVFYQLYVRSGDPDVFLAARKELLAYREQEIIHEGPERGRHITYTQTRYLYVEALADDYLLTGDPRSREVAKTMVEYMTRVFPPSKAFYPHGASNFWTEREAAFPFLGVLYYYEMTGEPAYRKLADDYMAQLYRTQQEWPARGGFIHNLYAHDTSEGARPDEYGGSPFMTGLLLEAVIEYHRLTGDETAARSIVLALDWLMHEGLAGDGDTFLYLTADSYHDEPGQPDLNMLIVHAFGYGYQLSGFIRTDYLELGTRLFQRGIQDAYLGKRKHFNQNYRSSGHFLAYIASATAAPGALPPIGEVLYQGDFEYGPDGWAAADGMTTLELDAHAFSGRRALKVRREQAGPELAVRKMMPGWSLDAHPLLHLAYKAPQGMVLGVRCQTSYNDWVTLGEGAPEDSAFTLPGDGRWHQVTLDVGEGIHRVLPGVRELQGCQVVTRQAVEAGSAFWIDGVKITQ